MSPGKVSAVTPAIAWGRYAWIVEISGGRPVMTTQTVSKAITFDNVLFATDFSKQSDSALPYALSIAHKYGSKIFATHVLTPPPLGNFPTIEVQALAAQALREAHDYSNELGRRLGAIPHETLLRKGEIWDEL